MKSILDLLPSDAHVLRDGSFVKIPSSDLVTGDIVQISIGNKVPADVRILSSSGDVRFDRSVSHPRRLYHSTLTDRILPLGPHWRGRRDRRCSRGY